MINIKQAKLYCNGDITQIENYEKAINDKTQIWVCHHRKETDEGLYMRQLIQKNLYYNIPPNELIFLTRSEHGKLHNSVKYKDADIQKQNNEDKKFINRIILLYSTRNIF